MSAVVARTLACLMKVRRLVMSYQSLKVTKLTTLSRAIKPLAENRYKGIRVVPILPSADSSTRDATEKSEIQ